MNLTQIISLQCGGPGSGRHKEYGNFIKVDKNEYITPDKQHSIYIIDTGDNTVIRYNTSKTTRTKTFTNNDEATRHLNDKYGIDVKKENDKQNQNQTTISDFEKLRKHIFGGGPGSGRHPYGRKEKDEGKQKRGLDSYVPMTKSILDRATQNEKNLVSALGGCCHLGDNQPFDVILQGKRIGFEVKTKITGRKNTITMHPDSLRRKLKAWKKMKLTAVYTIIFDDRKGKIYYAPGVGSFKLDAKNPSVKEVKDLKQLKKEIGL